MTLRWFHLCDVHRGCSVSWPLALGGRLGLLEPFLGRVGHSIVRLSQASSPVWFSPACPDRTPRCQLVGWGWRVIGVGVGVGSMVTTGTGGATAVRSGHRREPAVLSLGSRAGGAPLSTRTKPLPISVSHWRLSGFTGGNGARSPRLYRLPRERECSDISQPNPCPFVDSFHRVHYRRQAGYNVSIRSTAPLPPIQSHHR